MDEPHTETFRDFLDRREAQLNERIYAIRCELGPLEKELAEIHKTRETLGIRQPFFVPPPVRDAARVSAPSKGAENLDQLLERVVRDDIPPDERTIKELIIKALWDFPIGATPEEIGEHISKTLGRSVNPGSIRPNLSRLREAGVIMHDGLASKWIIDPKAVGTLTLLYENTPIIRLARELAWREDGEIAADLNKVAVQSDAEINKKP